MDPLRYLTADTAGIGGNICAAPDDFLVEEVPLYQPMGVGEHVYCMIEKRDLTTREAVARIARALSIKEREIGIAGNKDRHAVSRQLVSIRGVTEKAVRALTISGIVFLWIKRHNNKLRVGHLKGNRFRIRVTGVDSKGQNRVENILESLLRRGVPNYFGRQRFGRRRNSHLIGEALLFGNDKEVISRLGNKSRMYFFGAKRSISSIKHDYKFFFIHAYQSHLFNRCLERRLEEFDQLWEGDLAYKHDNGAVFRVASPHDEAARLARFEISPSGPLFGYKMIAPEGRQSLIEDEVTKEANLESDHFNLRFKQAKIKGARRSLRFQIKDLEWKLTGGTLEISFFLPKGCYATCLLREIMKTEAL